MENMVRNKFVLERRVCVYLKGIAILFVICGHILGGTFGILDPNATAFLGTGGVNLFLILSGYGLFVSYQKKGLNTKEYWNKKINQIFIPYGCVTCLYFLFLRLKGGSVGVYTLLLNLFCVDYSRQIDGTMWYMSFLLLWYLLFFVIYYFDYPQFIKVTLLFAAGYVFRAGIMASVFLDCNWQFAPNAYAFPVGVLIGYAFGLANKYMPEIWSAFIQKWIGPITTCVCVGLLLCGFWGMLTLSYLQIGLCYLVVFYFVLRLLSHKLTLLHWIGTNSFLLYLIEAKVMAVVGLIKIVNQNVVSYLAVYVVLIYLCVLVYNFIYPRAISILQKVNV